MQPTKARVRPGPVARAIRVAYLIVAWAFVGAILVQVFFAGLMVFTLFTAPTYIDIHTQFGYWIGIFPLVLLVLAPLGRLPRGLIIVSAILFALYFVQTSLPTIPEPFVAAFHPVVALLLFGLATMAAVRARRFVPRPLGTASAPTATPP